MYSTHPDLTDPSRTAAIRILQARLSDVLDFEAQMKQAYWNVNGPNLFQRRQVFDSLHGALEGYVDLLAERITALGGAPDGRVTADAAPMKLQD